VNPRSGTDLSGLLKSYDSMLRARYGGGAQTGIYETSLCSYIVLASHQLPYAYSVDM